MQMILKIACNKKEVSLKRNGDNDYHYLFLRFEQTGK